MRIIFGTLRTKKYAKHEEPIWKIIINIAVALPASKHLQKACMPLTLSIFRFLLPAKNSFQISMLHMFYRILVFFSFSQFFGKSQRVRG